MLSRTLFLRATLRALAMQLYTSEQLAKNPALKAMPADQRKTIIEAMFKGLTVAEVNSLQKRASTSVSTPASAADHVTTPAELAASLAAELDKPPPAPANRSKKKKKPSGKAAKRRAAPFVELTPYEFFVREQRNNPAVTAVAGATEREAKLSQIYATLPEAAREALQQRAADYNDIRRYGKVESMGAAPRKAVIMKASKPQKLLTKRMLERMAREARRAAQRAAQRTRLEAKSRARAERAAEREQRKNRKKRAASPYALFVKKQMAELTGLPFTERMREAGKRWRALSEEARAEWLAKGVAAKGKAVAAEPSATPAQSPAAPPVEVTPILSVSVEANPNLVSAVISEVPKRGEGERNKEGAEGGSGTIRATLTAAAASTPEPVVPDATATAAIKDELATAEAEIGNASGESVTASAEKLATDVPARSTLSRGAPVATPATSATPTSSDTTTAASPATAATTIATAPNTPTATPAATSKRTKLVVKKRLIKKKRSSGASTAATAKPAAESAA